MTSKDGAPVEGGRKPVCLSNLTKRFRVTLEESFAHERPETRTPDRRWYEVIPCQGFKKPPEQEGPFISLYSEDPPTLMLFTNRVINGKSIWNSIKKHPGTRADFHMDGEAVLYFPPELLSTVAEMAGARKKRILTEEQRAALIERGKAGREALKRWQKQRVQLQNSTQDATIPHPAGG